MIVVLVDLPDLKASSRQVLGHLAVKKQAAHVALAQESLQHILTGLCHPSILVPGVFHDI
jgi:hypothetical protein